MNSPPILLESRNIGRLAPGRRNWLLRDVSLEVRGGEHLAIVGPSGSGKTLLLRSLALLDSLDEGQVLWLGAPISPEAVPDFRRQAIYLHQRPPLMEGTVKENLEMPFSLAIHAHERFDREWVVSLLDRVGRGPEFLDQAGRELSGGEAQVVAVIRALQLHPRVLLLDEPTASLDAATAQAIEQLVAGWHREAAGERATVWVTHDHEQSSRVADRLLWMKSGHLVPGE